MDRADGLLKDGERLDDLERNGYRLIQNPSYFCFGMDAILLSGFAAVSDGAALLDLCTGNGIIPILMAAKSKASRIEGLELIEENADMARRSVTLNGLGERVHITTGDVKDAVGIYGASSFDVVTANPPYMIAGHGLKNPDGIKAYARHEIALTLKELIEHATRLLKPGGSAFFVHRPFRLTELLGTMHDTGLEPKRMRLVYPFSYSEPTMVLVSGVRGGKPYLTVEKPLIIYAAQDVYTDEIREIYGF